MTTRLNITQEFSSALKTLGLTQRVQYPCSLSGSGHLGRREGVLQKLLTVALITAIGVFVSSAPANAAVMATLFKFSSDPSVAGDISASDLVNTGSAALSGVDSSGYSPILSANASPNGVLIDGLHGYRSGASSLAASSNPIWTITYSLTGGHDIDSIVLFSAAEDNRTDPNFQVLFETVGNPGYFVSLGTFNKSATSGDPTWAGSWKVTVEDDGGSPLGTNISAVRFAFSNGLVAPTFYSEIDIFEAAAVPEPSTLALCSVGLAGMGLFAWRRRRCS